MSTEALKLICAMDRNRLEAQIGLQCAPLLTGLKISNLLTIPSKMRQQVSQVFRKTGISVFLLYHLYEYAASFSTLISLHISRCGLQRRYPFSSLPGSAAQVFCILLPDLQHKCSVSCCRDQEFRICMNSSPVIVSLS